MKIILEVNFLGIQVGVYFCKTKPPSNNFEILQSCIWYNNHLSGEAVFFTKWYYSGMSLIEDIVESIGEFMTLQKIEKIFGLKMILVKTLEQIYWKI